jgi:hypothetical protein
LLKFKARIFTTFLALLGKRFVGTKLHTKDDIVTMLVIIVINANISTPIRLVE